MNEADETTISKSQHRTIGQTLAYMFVQAVRNAFGRRPWQATAEEGEDDLRTEAALRARYPGTVQDWLDQQRRATAHGIEFAVIADVHHRAAILDFLDDPSVPTLLHGMHLTWFVAIDPQTGRSTTSCVHHANRAVYEWNARHWASAIPRNDFDVEVLGRLREHFPLKRVGWTAEQWAAQEKSDANQLSAWPKNGGPFPTKPEARTMIRDHRLGV